MGVSAVAERKPEKFIVKCPRPTCEGTIKLDERSDYGYGGEIHEYNQMACDTCLEEVDSDGEMTVWPPPGERRG